MRNRLKGWALSALVGLVATLGMAGSAIAQQSGLGSSWPNAPDVSKNASFHAYRWARDGVEFVQVNGADGNPLAAVATDGQAVMVLPVGNPSLVTPVAKDTSVEGQTVYVDASVSILVTSNGLSVQPLGAAVCGDPVECSKPKEESSRSTQGTNVIRAMSCDPIECSKPLN